MAQQIECSCGTLNDPGSKYCKKCSRPFGTEWKKARHEFAVNVPEEKYNKASKDAVIIPYGSKGLIFEDGQLVESIESGKYTFQKASFLKRLFQSKEQKSHSVFIVDAGDVSMAFKYKNIHTADDIPVDLSIELEFRCDNSNLFFINIMKNQTSFELDEFRPILWEQVKNALESGFKQYQFEDLNTGLQFKKELASHLESHLRITFERNGLDFVQVKAISFSQEILDRLKKKATERKFKKQEIEGNREDIDLQADQMDVDIEETGKLGNKEIDHNLVKAELLQKRVDVLKGIQKADVEKIKTKEDFRKFQQEIDRDQRSYLGLRQGFLGMFAAREFRSSDVAAEVLVIEFFNIHCMSCQRQAPVMNEVFDRINSHRTMRDRVRFFGIGVGNTGTETDLFMRRYSVGFPLFADPGFKNYEAIGEPGATPLTVIVRKSGNDLRIVSAHVGLEKRSNFFMAKIRTALEITPEALASMSTEKQPEKAEPSMRMKLDMTAQEVQKRVLASMRKSMGEDVVFKKIIKKTYPRSGEIYVARVEQYGAASTL